MRQQLDELDALLQRMLTLPVNHLAEPEDKQRREAPLTQPLAKARNKFATLVEKPSTPPRPVVDEKVRPPLPDDRPTPLLRTESPSGLPAPISVLPTITSASAPSLAEPPPATEMKSVISSPGIVLPEIVPESEPGETPGGRGAEQSRAFRAPDAAPSAEPIIPKKPSEFLERHRARLREERRAAPWLKPLEWINRLFDRCAVALGRPGLWLVRPETRDFLGWIGIGLLLAAAVILVGDWFGWTW
jgi:hypothetical protein